MLRIVAACGLLLVATAVRAQASASVSLVSDDRYRGVSLSDGEPALQLAAGFDADAGAYGGAFASTARLYGRDMLRWVGYAGWAGRFGHGASWDVGAQYTGFTAAPRDAYAELYAGVSGERVGVRVAYAPRYFGGDAAWYASVDAQQPWSSRWRLLAHAGWLYRPQGGTPAWDARVGLGVQLAGFELQLARSLLHAPEAGYGYGAAYPVGRDAAGGAWVFGVTRRW